jgi:hypothetical protein
VLEIKNGQLVVKDHAQLTEDQLAAVASVEEVITKKGLRTLRVKQHDKLAALALLSKLVGITPNKLEVSGPGGQPIAVDHTLGTARERLAARLDGIATKQEERPVPLQRVNGDLYRPVPVDEDE